MRIRVAALLLFAAAVPASAQRLHEHITVDLIEVPVHVTRNGKAVADLTKESFELYVNGARHPIEYFDVLDDRIAAGEETPQPQILERRRLIVLLFDVAMTQRRSIMRAKEAAMKFVSEARAEDTFAVAVMARGGAQFIVPFTDDHIAVQRAILTLTPSRAGDALNLATLSSERALWMTSDFAGSGEPNNDNLFPDFATFPNNPISGSDDLARAAYRAQRQAEELGRADVKRKFTNDLGDLAERLAPISGVKHVVLLSDGSPGASDQDEVRMHNRFRAAGVILDAVSLRGAYIPYTPFDSSRESFSALLSPRKDETASLYNLALDTGGAVARHGDIAEGLRFLRDMQSVTYILAFRPPAASRKNNTITVRVRNQPFGTTVNYRRGYSRDPQGDRSDGLFLADVLMNDIPQRGLSLDLKVEREGETAKIVASVPGIELLAHGEERKDAPLIDVFLYVFDEKDQVVGWGYWRLQLDLEKGRAFLAANPYTVQQEISLGSGRYSAKALLRFVDSDVAGFRRADFEIVSK